MAVGGSSEFRMRCLDSLNASVTLQKDRPCPKESSVRDYVIKADYVHPINNIVLAGNATIEAGEKTTAILEFLDH
jgi:hypothetical protein